MPDAEVMILAVEAEIKLRNTRTTMAATMKVNTPSSLLMTLSRSFKLAIIALRSRPTSAKNNSQQRFGATILEGLTNGKLHFFARNITVKVPVKQLKCGVGFLLKKLLM